MARSDQHRDLKETQIRDHLDNSRLRVDLFIAEHFNFKSVFELQKRHLLNDLWKLPINTLWAIPYLFIKKAAEFADRFALDELKEFLLSIPNGLKTGAEREIEHKIVHDLIVLPAGEAKAPIENYFNHRTSFNDLASSVLTLAFGSITEMGNKLASRIAHDEAASDFFLGRSLGSAFYNIFPRAPTTVQIVTSTAVILLLVSLFSVIVQFLSDPLQAKLGIHRRKLYAMLDQVEDQLHKRLRGKKS